MKSCVWPVLELKSPTSRIVQLYLYGKSCTSLSKLSKTLLSTSEEFSWAMYMSQCRLESS